MLAGMAYFVSRVRGQRYALLSRYRNEKDMVANMEISKRNSALDITRIVALFCVISVHFFLNNGFYKQPVLGWRMYVMTTMRTAFMICVPLFIMLTGYLMCRKTFSLKYYRGIVKTLGIYLLASIACALYKIFVLKRELNADLVMGLFDYSTATYAWYIEMYIGLFLLIPFLNAMWNGLGSQKAKTALVITLLCLTTLPSLINIYNFEVAGWWKTPNLSDDYRQLVPDWWTRIYPLTYYFMGAYLREFPLKLKQRTKLLIWGVSIIAFGAFNFYRSHGKAFAWEIYNDWGGFNNVIMTFFAFSFLSSIRTENYPVKLKRALMLLSDLCLGGYLVSYIFDNLIYAELNARVKPMPNRLEWYIVVVPAVFVCSLALSGVLNLIYRGIARGCTALRSRLKQTSAAPQPVLLETERLILRPFRESDADDVFAYASDPDVGPMAGWRPHESPQKSLEIVRGFISSGEVWAVESKETHKVIGTVGLHPEQREGYSFDYQLGYVLAKSCWGQGLMTEAAGRIVSYAFETGAKTLFVAHFDGNERSKRVIEKLGFRYAGHIDDGCKRYDGAVLGESVYLLDAADFKAAESEDKPAVPAARN